MEDTAAKDVDREATLSLLGLGGDPPPQIDPQQLERDIDSERRRQLTLLTLQQPSIESLVGEVASWRAIAAAQQMLLDVLGKRLSNSDQVSDVVIAVIQELSPDITRGQAVARGGKKGHETVYGSDSEKTTERARYRKVCLAVLTEHPGWGLGKIRQEAGKRCEVSARTIARSVTDLAQLKAAAGSNAPIT